VITSSDDTSIKVWTVKDDSLELQKTLKEHTHFVMQVALNPKDPQMLASCSLDTTVKVWNMNFLKSQITLTGHEQGVNCVEYFKGDKPYILSGGDDKMIKIWDY
jgi:coatomer subunit beta'